MITNNIINRVFRLRYGGCTGTCFVVDYEQKQYFITAKHVVANLQYKDTIEIYKEEKRITINTHLIGHHKTADVTIFCLEIVGNFLPIEANGKGVVLSQDVFFLGFPYRIHDQRNSYLNHNFPIPLIKKAIISCITSDETGLYLLLDGINNPGFSGGPVVFQEPNKKDFKIIGIISGYYNFSEPTYYDDEETETGILTKPNSGIIIAYHINNAIDLIKENPIGLNLN